MGIKIRISLALQSFHNMISIVLEFALEMKEHGECSFPAQIYLVHSQVIISQMQDRVLKQTFTDKWWLCERKLK